MTLDIFPPNSKVGIRTSKNLLMFGLNSWNTINVGLKAAIYCVLWGLKSLSYIWVVKTRRRDQHHKAGPIFNVRNGSFIIKEYFVAWKINRPPSTSLSLKSLEYDVYFVDWI